MTCRILVMGLPGSGKTTFSQELVKRLMLNHSVTWLNADTVRKEFNDWDFTPAGRLRQTQRMRELADTCKSDYVICDFVCPTDEYRRVFDADVTVFMDTLEEGRFDDTNRLFKAPRYYSYRVYDWNQTEDIIDNLIHAYAKSNKESPLRSIVKAISWRVWGTIDTFILSWLVTGQVEMAATIGALEITTKVVWYWIHERIWNKIKWGKQ
jgi:adenylylsulfate kinase